MMNYIWGILIIISILCAIVTNRTSELSTAVFTGAESSITLVISMLGMMCLWTGLMNIAEKSGFTSLLSRFFHPVIKKFFPSFSKDSPQLKAICMNIAANLLGLGNAATPMGIAAMKEMQKNNPNKKTATNEMVMFVVLNTASIQIMPTLMTALRQQHGSVAPLEILPAIWVTSVSALIIGIIIANSLEIRGSKLG